MSARSIAPPAEASQPVRPIDPKADKAAGRKRMPTPTWLPITIDAMDKKPIFCDIAVILFEFKEKNYIRMLSLLQEGYRDGAYDTPSEINRAEAISRI